MLCAKQDILIAFFDKSEHAFLTQASLSDVMAIV